MYSSSRSFVIACTEGSNVCKNAIDQLEHISSSRDVNQGAGSGTVTTHEEDKPSTSTACSYTCTRIIILMETPSFRKADFRCPVKM